MKMSQLDSLPLELVLNLLSYLPVQSLCSLCLLSRYWRDLISENESSIYHHAALLHRFVSSVDLSLSEATSVHIGKHMKDIDSWKSFCQMCFRLEQNWVGQGSATIKAYGSFTDVHRIKVDEAAGLLITTHQNGGLRVRDIESGDLLWELPSSYVREAAHCEYEKGFLIFDRIGSFKEVWCLRADYDATQAPSNSPPDQSQLNAFDSAETYMQILSDSSRGHFRPWALVRMPEQCGAFRFAYPTLTCVSATAVYLWDIRSVELIQTIHDLQDRQGTDIALGAVRYVELSARHVFICGSTEFRVFDRSHGAVVLRMSARPSLPRKTVVLDLEATNSVQHRACDIVPVKASLVTAPTEVFWPSAFIGGHVSASGHDIAVLLSDDRMVLVRDFESVVKGEATLHDASLEVQFTSPPGQGLSYIYGLEQSVYIAFDSGRVAVVTTSGIFIFTLDAAYHGLLDPQRVVKTTLGLISDTSSISADTSFPHLSAAFISGFRGRTHDLAQLSCLQMTENKLYFTWNENGVPRDKEPRAKVTQDDARGMRLASAEARRGFLDDIPEFVEGPSAEVVDLEEDWGGDDDEDESFPEPATLGMWQGGDFFPTYMDAADAAAEFDEDMDDQGEEFGDEDDGYFGDDGGDWAEWQQEVAEYGAEDDEPDLPIVCCVDFTPA